MIRMAEGEYPRRLPPEGSLRGAFLAAHKAFVEKYGRGPRYGVATFQGKFTPFKVVFEITEETDLEGGAHEDQ